MVADGEPASIGRSPDRSRGSRNRSRSPPMREHAACGDHDGMPRRTRPFLAAEQEVHELEHTAHVGASEKTPLILLAEVGIVVAIAFVILLALALAAYRLAT
jgi:hypothetical protein